MMMLSEACIAMQGNLQGEDKHFTSVEFDTRRLQKDALFFAIHGEAKNGHEFIPQAIGQNAVAAVSDEPFKAQQETRHIQVEDTTIALGMLAAHWRERFSVPVVGITGSNGKTSVSQIVKQIFADSIPGVAPQGSFNNHWGVPLTLLKLREPHQSAVIEMGMNHAGELSYLGRIVKPTIGLITNAAAAHLEGLGDIQGVAKAKGELIDFVALDGVVVLNRDDTFYADWKARAGKRQVKSFGIDAAADVQLITGGSGQLNVRVDGEIHAYDFDLIGQHNQLNAAAAIAVALSANVPKAAIQQGLKNATAVKGRLQVFSVAPDITLIDDTYNANAASMFAAVDVLTAQTGRKILVLGAMGELGAKSVQIHREVGAYAQQQGVDVLLTLVDQADASFLNDMSAYTAGFGRNTFAFSQVAPLIDKLKSFSDALSTILVKGSRFAQMERVVEAFKTSGGTPC